MNIWIDINHVPQFNFYKKLILLLTESGNEVWVTVLQRGKLFKIVTNELNDVPNVHVVSLGRHRMTKFSAIFEANLLRIPQMIYWKNKQKIDVGFSNGFQLALVSKINNIPNYSFDDDPQTVDYKYKVKYNTICHFCIYSDSSIPNPVIVLPVLKEWAYLAPKYFTPNPQVLEKYGVQPKKYVFLREVSVGTVNYAGQASGAILGIQDLIPKDKKVLFSLEEKDKRYLYPKDWILLQEPIEEIHSLIYYSAGLVSSGDSMAREAALLGVPAYYLGIRYDMPANAAAAKVANLQNQKTADFSQWVKNLSITPEMAEEQQIKLRKHIDEEFIDINEYMLALVEKTNKKDNN